jgi:hypothetical protein
MKASKDAKKVHELWIILNKVKLRYEKRGVKFPKKIREGNEEWL